MSLPPVTPAMGFVFAVILVALMVVEPATATVAEAGLLDGPLYVLHQPGDDLSPR